MTKEKLDRAIELDEQICNVAEDLKFLALLRGVEEIEVRPTRPVSNSSTFEIVGDVKDRVVALLQEQRAQELERLKKEFAKL